MAPLFLEFLFILFVAFGLGLLLARLMWRKKRSDNY